MMFGFVRKPKAGPRTPKGHRAYAVGDVHGRLDLLELILADIERDIAGRPRAENHVVFLGDLIDRGPDSRGVIDRLKDLRSESFKPVFLIGNHEEVLLRLLGGEAGLLRSWMKFGGAECARSYGLDPQQLDHLPEKDALAALRAAVPRDHSEFLESFIDTFRFGDYRFVHAGIRPGIELSAQSQRDLRWIRAAFLDDPTDHGFMVVHGHTIREEVDERRNRIGIDTGAYATGVLTALGLEKDQRWYLSTDATLSEQTASLVD
jgi:serine/threonine protein phosphatase 1